MVEIESGIQTLYSLGEWRVRVHKPTLHLYLFSLRSAMGWSADLPYVFLRRMRSAILAATSYSPRLLGGFCASGY